MAALVYTHVSSITTLLLVGASTNGRFSVASVFSRSLMFRNVWFATD